MFALLFDRRSLIVTGVALAAVGSLLFAAGLVTGLTLRRERVVVEPSWLKYGPVETSDLRATDPSQRARWSRPARGGTGAGAAPALPPTGAGPAPAAGDTTDGDPSLPPDHVPFSRPGDPTPSEAMPPEGGVRAEPPAASGSEGDSEGDSGAGSTDPAAPPPEPATGTQAPPAATRRAADDCPEPGQPAWFVQTGAYAVAANARDRQETLEARFATGGPRPYLRRTTSSAGVELTLVRLGPFATREAARRAAAALDDAFVGIETGDAAGLCGGEGGREAVAGRETPWVAVAARVSLAG